VYIGEKKVVYSRVKIFLRSVTELEREVAGVLLVGEDERWRGRVVLRLDDGMKDVACSKCTRRRAVQVVIRNDLTMVTKSRRYSFKK